MAAPDNDSASRLFVVGVNQRSASVLLCERLFAEEIEPSALLARLRAAGGGAAYLLGPTGGYLAAFPVAAAVAGLGYRSHWRLPVRLAMLALGVTVIHLMGIAWLQLVMSTPVSFASHVAPFVVGDVLKVAFVLLLGSGLRTPMQRSWLTQ